ncbi:MAG: acetylglutamate kinase [Anaerolineales bacterium]|nr:acetylglutamate kinase [Anaerolineales bacterium]
MYVYKIGGNELDQPDFLPELAKCLAADSGPKIIVHGGGKAIADLQARLGLATKKVEGLRVTDAESLIAAEMVLSGQANKQIVSALIAAGLDAIGISGVDRGLLRCRKKQHPAADLGFVGEIVQVRNEVITQLLDHNIIPVISPISIGLDGKTYNVNADEAASAIAAALGADLVMISNVPGVLDNGVLVPTLSPSQTEQLIQQGVISDGMTPKVRAAVSALMLGAPQVRIANLAGLNDSTGTLFIQ